MGIYDEDTVGEKSARVYPDCICPYYGILLWVDCLAGRYSVLHFKKKLSVLIWRDYCQATIEQAKLLCLPWGMFHKFHLINPGHLTI